MLRRHTHTHPESPGANAFSGDQGVVAESGTGRFPDVRLFGACVRASVLVLVCVCVDVDVVGVVVVAKYANADK